ncbi:MAG: SufE family protein [Actinobacteria bacterium]|nr:SufE family protein [Actinomycetota bacterium]
MSGDALPGRLGEIVDEFSAAPDDLRIELLLEFAESLPSLPPHLDSSDMEQVVECQTPFFLHAEVDDERVSLWFDCPPEAPTTRAFAGILADGLRGGTVDDVLAVPEDLAERMGLGQTISPLRLRGMHAVVFRLRRRVGALAAAR